MPVLRSWVSSSRVQSRARYSRGVVAQVLGKLRFAPLFVAITIVVALPVPAASAQAGGMAAHESVTVGASGDGGGDSGEDLPAWPFAVGVVAAVGAAALWATRRRP
ncbi:hypothetical protein [Mycobacterium ulcerans]|uniref:Secreted protein n=1 Tax=Mycobacterium ulcerans subsp. shinshuense TaxID=1124626 RepID=A0A1B4Y9W5_MYCUL|nr:hypothetical protein [Mycobacterium ulcerans]BAV43841.1 hypothetical protein SHTP_5007 [Mycobacterium ulcerans subsp. shinshuense]